MLRPALAFSLLGGVGLVITACDGPNNAARKRYVEDPVPASQASEDDKQTEPTPAAVALEPYPEWGELTSACGDAFVASRLRPDLTESGGSADAGLAQDAGPRASSDAGLADAALRPTGDAGLADVVASPERGLRDLGQLVGVALAGYRLGDADYAGVAVRDFNFATPENEMKWDAIEPSQGRFTFRPADGIVQFAQDHDMLVKGHTLVWHSQLPSWVNALAGADAVRSAMSNHIESVMSHYRDEFPGRVVAWDVVNEAIDSRDGSAYYRDSVFYRELGEGFIEEAFRLAHEVDPEALLFYNDFGIESLGAKSQLTFEMVRGLVEAGVPIDGVGFQMHTTANDLGPTLADFTRNLERYVDLGLLISISEMDVNLCWGFENRADAIAAQRVRVRQLVRACLDTSQCHSVSVWGVADSNSWLNDLQPCENPADKPWPLLYSDDYERKPAWWGMFDALSGCTE